VMLFIGNLRHYLLQSIQRMPSKTVFVPFLSILWAVVFSMTASAQQEVTVVIKLANKKNAPVPFASITVVDRGDSTRQLTQTADSSGKASFSLQTGGQYLATATAVGYRPLTKGIVAKQQTFAFVMEEESTTLKGVVVTARKPLMRQEDDKTIIDPENLAASSTNAYEILEKTPGLFVDQDGNIYLTSTTPATIYINGREMRMSAADVATMLKSLPPGSIARLEVLRTPSAKYDASGGGGIVNVILKKGVKIGLTGSINMGMQQGVYGNQFAGINLNNNNGRVTTYLTFNGGRRNSYEQIRTTRAFAPDSILTQDAYTRYPSTYTYTGYGVSAEMGKKWELSYDGRISTGYATNNTINPSVINKASTGAVVTSNQGDIDNSSRTLAINQGLATKYKIDSAGSEWTVDVSYNYNNNRNNQLFVTDFSAPVVASVAGDGNIRSHRHFTTAQTDLKWKISKTFTVETGAKASLLSFRNATDFFREQGGLRSKDPQRTNTFRYTENIYAAYIQSSKTIAGVVVKAGVRMENTNMNGRQLIPADTSFDIHRTDFFPYVYISRKLMTIAGFPLTAYLVYRRTISRPVYEYLNPFQRFVDAYLTETGNPTLRPQFTQNVEANISMEERPILAVGYNYTKDIFSSVVYQAEGNRSTALRTYDNLGTNRELYFRALGAIPPGGKYFFVLGTQYNHNYYNGIYENRPLSFKRGTWSFFTYQTLKLGKRSVFSLNGFWRLKGQQQFYELGSFGALNVSINRQFFNKKLVVTLSGNDLFFTNNNAFAIRQGTVDAFGFRQGDTRRFGINLRYSFGIRKKEDNNNPLNMESPEKAN
jgi:iron complex outermembrane recepter protein